MQVTLYTTLDLDLGQAGDISIHDHEINTTVSVDEVEYVTTEWTGDMLAYHFSQDDLQDHVDAAGWELPKPTMDAGCMAAMAQGAGITLEEFVEAWVTLRKSEDLTPANFEPITETYNHVS